jgi:hypothetical protein
MVIEKKVKWVAFLFVESSLSCQWGEGAVFVFISVIVIVSSILARTKAKFSLAFFLRSGGCNIFSTYAAPSFHTVIMNPFN